MRPVFVLCAGAQAWKLAADAAPGPRGEQEGKTASYSIAARRKETGCILSFACHKSGIRRIYFPEQKGSGTHAGVQAIYIIFL